MSDSLEIGKKYSVESNKEKLILLLLKKELREKFMKTLVNRLFELDVTVAVDEIDYPLEKQKKFHWILNFPGDIPRGKTANVSTAGQVFRVTGSPKINTDNFTLKHTEKLEKLIKRFNEKQFFTIFSQLCSEFLEI